MGSQPRLTGEDLERRFTAIYEQRLKGLPIVNPKLKVAAIGLQPFEDFEVGVLVTPWFMNLVLLPAADTGIEQGHKVNARFASGEIEFTAARDEELGLYLSAALFSSVLDIPDQATAEDLASEVMLELFTPSETKKTVSRRALFNPAGQADA